VQAFRLCRHDHTVLGAGGLYVDGRWRRNGSRIVYTASTISLALLEVRVHHETAPLGWVVVEMMLPDGLIESIDSGSLPTDWPDHRQTTQKHGEDWLQSRRSALLSVPSAIVRSERNFILNPLHAEFTKIQVKPAVPFPIDPRLFRGPAASAG